MYCNIKFNDSWLIKCLNESHIWNAKNKCIFLKISQLGLFLSIKNQKIILNYHEKFYLNKIKLGYNKIKMSVAKLHYFNGHGKAEILRLVMAATGVKVRL